MDTDLALKTIMQNLLPFVGVTLLVVEDFLQLVPVKQKFVLINQVRDHMGQSHELFEIV